MRRGWCDINTDERQKPVRIVVIDSGINASKSDLSRFVKESIGFRVNNEGYIVEDKNIEIKNKHGTVIAMIIRNICKNVEFISMNILNERLATDGRILICAFHQALDYKPDIIHLSLGTTRWRYRFALRKIVKEAEKNNIIVVSAANNEGLKSYPAYTKGVVGVKGRADITGYREFWYQKGFFYAPLGVRDIYGINEIDNGERSVGNSMAAAYITGHIASIKCSKNIKSNAEIIEYLKSRAVKKTKE
ncbi:MAG: S8 family serine peptidase [Clostridia bacterium]|nr:S8 family serine peptidase [Clostridia bacterium]